MCGGFVALFVISLRLYVIIKHQLAIFISSCVIDLAGIRIIHIRSHVLLWIALEPGKRVQWFECHLLFARIRLYYGGIPRRPSFIGDLLFVVQWHVILALWFEHQTVFEKPFVCGIQFIFGWTNRSFFPLPNCVLQMSIFDVLRMIGIFIRVLRALILYVNDLFIDLWSNWLTLVFTIRFWFKSWGIMQIQFVDCFSLLFDLIRLILLLLFLHTMK